MNKLILLGIIFSFSLISNAQFREINDPIRLGGTVNTEAEESMPVFSQDSSILYFTRTYDKDNKGGENDQDIWLSKKDKDGNYIDCSLVKELNNKLNNAVFGINKAGNTIYLIDAYEGKKDLVKGCASSVKKGSSWDEPKHVNIPTLDIEGDYYGFHVNENESIMIISYKGPNTIGEEDLYFSKKENGVWTAPVHMGATLNTSGFEISPFLTKNLDTLFFSSNGLGGQGDADIFFSIRQDDSYTNWSTPVNLGSKINSPKFDAYFSCTPSTLYWSSNRDGEKSDIYLATFVKIPPLFASAVGTDVTVYKGSDGKIDLTPTGGVAPYTYKWSNGSTVEDPSGLVKGEYTVTVTDAIGQTVNVITPINEPELVVGSDVATLINLNPIYFDLGKWNIRPDAAKELDKIIAVLNENPSLVVELGSHTDCRSSRAFNMNLSNKRAASSTAYIKARITNPSRISGKGYGEERLKVNCPCEGTVLPNCPEDQHQLNRRTEFIVVSNNTKSDINKLEIINKVSSDNGVYKVKKGETLYRVSLNTGIKVEQLKKINNMTTNDVKEGQIIKLK